MRMHNYSPSTWADSLYEEGNAMREKWCKWESPRQKEAKLRESLARSEQAVSGLTKLCKLYIKEIAKLTVENDKLREQLRETDQKV